MQDQLIFRGVVYRKVEALNHPLSSESVSSLSTELDVAQAHLESVVEDAEKVLIEARKLISSLRSGACEVSDCLKEDGQVSPNKVRLLSPEGRQESYMVPLRSMEKANRMLNYTVDAAISAIKTVIEQVDTMVDEWTAALHQMNAPNTSRELTAPMQMTDNPAAEVPEL